MIKIGIDNIIPGMSGLTGYSRTETEGIAEGIVEFGRCITPGSSDKQLKGMTAITDPIVGIAMFDYYAQEVSEKNEYSDGKPLKNRKQGTVKVELGDTVKENDLLSVSPDGKTFWPKDATDKVNIPGRALGSGKAGDVIDIYVDFLTNSN